MMQVSNSYNIEDVVKSFHWLGHQQGYTELLAINPEYQPGKENYARNVQNNAFPKIWYIRNDKQLISFLSKYHSTHLCCFGVNSRPDYLKNKSGYARRARDDDIKVAQNFYLDFDSEASLNSKTKKTMEELLASVDSQLTEKGFNKPGRAFTGNGYHMLFSIQEVKTEEHSDIGERICAFYQELKNKISSDLNSFGFRLDNTTDLARVAKIYGTRKPGNENISRFYGIERVEDKALLEYLLSLPVEQKKRDRGANHNLQVTMYSSLPTIFLDMIEKDAKLANLWSGSGKESGDTSRSGYDMSVLHAAIKQGIKDVKALSTILALRPNGAVRGSGKGDEYIRVTVMKALENSNW